MSPPGYPVDGVNFISVNGHCVGDKKVGNVDNIVVNNQKTVGLPILSDRPYDKVKHGSSLSTSDGSMMLPQAASMRSALALIAAETLFSTIKNGSISKADTSSGYSGKSPLVHTRGLFDIYYLTVPDLVSPIALHPKKIR